MDQGFLTLRFFYFTAQQQTGLARGALHPLFRRSASRSSRVWRWFIRNIGGSMHRPQNRPRIISRRFIRPTEERHAGAVADAGEHGARSNRRRAISRTGCLLRGVGRLTPCHHCARRSIVYVHRPPADAPVAQLLHRMAAPGATPARLRGIAGASIVVEAPAPADPERSRLAAGHRRSSLGRR